VTRDRFHGPAALTIPHAMATRAAAPISLGRPPQPDSRPALSPVMGAIRALAQEESSEAMLTAACRELVTAVVATACYVSRIDDGVLRDAASWGTASADDGDYVYLLADYPVTQAVVERGESKAVSLSDPDVDPAEAFVLRDLGMHAVLILRLAVDGHPWGIVEIYDARPRTFGRAEIDVAELIVGQAAGLLARFQHGEALERLYRETLASLSNALEAKDDYTSSHTQQVVGLAVEVGERLRLTVEELRTLEFASLLHDIGKLRIPESILNKPGPLTDEEWAVMRTHPEVGERILRPISSLSAVLPAVRSHHERWDGRGYPDGIAGPAIALAARIIAVCDAYRAMVEARPYRPAREAADALAELRACAGTQFDPACVEELVAVLDERARGRHAVILRPR